MDTKLEKMIEDFRLWSESKEGKRILEEQRRKEEFLKRRKNEYLIWFNTIGPERRDRYIKKILRKYDSKNYKDRWYDRGCIPPEDLKWFIYDYAYKFGHCWNALPEEAGPGFDEKFVFDDWKVILYSGQGALLIIDKVTDEDLKKGPNDLAQSFLGHEYDFLDKEYFEMLTQEFQ